MSINDGYFEYLADGSGINDRPAVNHGSSSSFSFADGHCELHKWSDAYLTYKAAITVTSGSQMAGQPWHAVKMTGTVSNLNTLQFG